MSTLAFVQKHNDETMWLKIDKNGSIVYLDKNRMQMEADRFVKGDRDMCAIVAVIVKGLVN